MTRPCPPPPGTGPNRSSTPIATRRRLTGAASRATAVRRSRAQWQSAPDVEVLLIPGVRLRQAIGEADPRPPAEREEARDVEQLARASIRLAAVEGDLPLEPHGLLHHLRDLGDRHVLPAADVQDL